MKLLLDHNLSPRLVNRLADIYSQASHVALLGLDRASDEVVWAYARENQFCIVTKDSDFNDLSVLRGFPPKVIWLQIGNCTTAELETLLRRHAVAIHDFLADTTVGTLVLL